MAERVEYVEIEVERCALVYGQSPCTAEVGTTGSTKCYNTFQTCQGRSNYSSEDYDEVLRFAKPSPALSRDIETVANNIALINYTPATVRLDGKLGERASLQVTFRDHPASDIDDPYIDDRAYTLVESFDRGTYWGKFRARFFPMRGQVLRYYRGFSDQTLAQMEKRTFIIDVIDGPRPNGTFSITAKDALKQIDGDRAQAPALNNGFLTSGISDTDTSLTIGPAGVGDNEYPSSGLAAIGGEEIVSFTRSGNTFTITRAQENTAAVAHDANTRVQLVLKYQAKDPAFIINDLLTTYANLAPSFIPLDAWEAEVDTNLAQVYTAVIPEPVAVRDLVEEVMQTAALALWYDEIDAQLKLRVLRGVPGQATELNENLLLADSFSHKEQFEKRLSQAWTYFAQNNPLQDREDTENYRSAVATIDSASELLFNDPSIRKRFSRWIPLGGRNTAQRLNDLILSQFATPPRRFRFALHAGATSLVPRPGQVYNTKFRTLQDTTGARKATPIFLTRVAAKWDRYDIEGEEFLFDPIDPLDLLDRVIIFDANDFNVDILTLHNALYPEITNDDVTGSDPVTLTVVVSSGVLIGSQSVNDAAMVIDGFPSALEVTLEMRGSLLGHGGKGGDSPTPPAPINPGEDGGTALYTRQITVIDFTSGAQKKIAGGGGGGESNQDVTFVSTRGGAGGGGGGQTPGAGGKGGGGVDDGEDGTPTSGGDGSAGVGTPTLSDGKPGGDPGFDGGGTNGGTRGFWVDGFSFTSITGTGATLGRTKN